MNRIRIVVLFSSAAMFPLASNLVAEQQVAAKVPFAFSVAGQNLPAGEYRIDHQGAFLCIENRQHHRLVTLIANPGDSSHDGRTFLSFETVDGVRRLRGVATPEAIGSVDLPASRQGKLAREAEHSAGFHR